MAKAKIKVLFSDLGGVLLTNGWDRHSRDKAIEKFHLDGKEFESRHQLLFGDYESGKISLQTYLRYTVFYRPCSFSYEAFTEFMYAQSTPLPGMLDYVRSVKKEHGLKVVAISNEGKELTDFRIESFGLREVIDFFIVSCYIGIKKPDIKVWQLALDLTQVKPGEVIYLDDRQLFVDLAKDLGMHAFCHKNLAETNAALEKLLKD